MFCLSDWAGLCPPVEAVAQYALGGGGVWLEVRSQLSCSFPSDSGSIGIFLWKLYTSCVNSLCLNCETKTSNLSQFWPTFRHSSRVLSKSLLTPLFLMGCFPVDFQEVERPLRAKSVKRPIKVGKRPINEGKRPIKAKVLVGVSVGSLMGCFRAPPPWRKTAPLKRPIKRSMFYPSLANA